MDKNTEPNKIQMPEHIKKMFEQRHKQSEALNSDILSSQEQVEKPQEENQEEQEIKGSNEQQSNDQVVDAVDTEDDKANNEDTKKKKKFGKKWIIVICVSLLCIIGLVVGLVVGLSPKYTKMSTPTVSVKALSNRTIVSVDENKDAVYYEFTIYRGQDKKTIRSKDSSVTINSYLSTVGEYRIVARYIGENTREDSDYSVEYTYIYKEVLDKPLVTIEQNALVWQKVDNAVSYNVYYGTDDDEILYFVQPATDDGSQKVSFDLTKLNSLKPGEYYLYVQAIAEQDGYYFNSDLSDSVKYDCVKQLLKPSDVSYDKQTGTLTFTISKTLEENWGLNYSFEIEINKTSKYICTASTVGTVSIDLKPYTNGSDITSLTIKAIGDDVYLISSDIVTVELK